MQECWEKGEITEKFKLGSVTKQYAEIAAVLWALKSAVETNVSILVLCTDLSYVRSSFLFYLHTWHNNRFQHAKGKQIGHFELIKATSTSSGI